MWHITINCSAEGWTRYNQEFRAIADRYPELKLITKKMKDDERRIMEGDFDDVDDAEAFTEACSALDGFIATFEAN